MNVIKVNVQIFQKGSKNNSNRVFVLWTDDNEDPENVEKKQRDRGSSWRTVPWGKRGVKGEGGECKEEVEKGTDPLDFRN